MHDRKYFLREEKMCKKRVRNKYKIIKIKVKMDYRKWSNNPPVSNSPSPLD